MSIVVTSPSEKQVNEQIKAMRAASARITQSKETARDYLLQHGYITKSGRLTKRYGG